MAYSPYRFGYDPKTKSFFAYHAGCKWDIEGRENISVVEFTSAYRSMTDALETLFMENMHGKGGMFSDEVAEEINGMVSGLGDSNPDDPD